MEKFKIWIDEKAIEYRDQILTRLDEFIKQLIDMREEQVITGRQTIEINEQVGDHDKRIQRLEQVQQAA